MPYRRTAAVQDRLDAARERIVRAAHDLVATSGWGACSVAAVGASAGVATGTVYRHFPDKAALLVAVFRDAAQREVDAVAAAAAVAGPAADRATRLVETFAGRAFRAPRLAYALLAEPVDPAVEAERLRFRLAYREVVAAIVADGVAAGELPDQEAEVTAAAVVGALAEALVAPLHAAAPRGAQELVPALTTVVTRSIGAPT